MLWNYGYDICIHINTVYYIYSTGFTYFHRFFLSITYSDLFSSLFIVFQAARWDAVRRSEHELNNAMQDLQWTGYEKDNFAWYNGIYHDISWVLVEFEAPKHPNFHHISPFCFQRKREAVSIANTLIGQILVPSQIYLIGSTKHINVGTSSSTIHHPATLIVSMEAPMIHIFNGLVFTGKF